MRQEVQVAVEPVVLNHQAQSQQLARLTLVVAVVVVGERQALPVALVSLFSGLQLRFL